MNWLRSGKSWRWDQFHLIPVPQSQSEQKSSCQHRLRHSDWESYFYDVNGFMVNPNPVTHLLEQSKSGHEHRRSTSVAHSQD